MERMRLTINGDSSVTISYWDEWRQERLTRTFFAGNVTGYVREWTNDGKQVCDCLASIGGTLRASKQTLPSVIRREYRAMRREERREGSR